MANVLTWLSIGSGFIAAGLWVWACKVSPNPGWGTQTNIEPTEPDGKTMGWIVAQNAAWAESGKRNAWAAGVTAGAAAFQALAQIAQQRGW